MKTTGRCVPKSRNALRRNGAATVELTVVLPVMLTLVLGTIEVCHRIFLRQTSVIVAYEGCRLAARSTSSTEDVVSRCEQMLSQRRVVGGQVTVIPASLLEQVPGTPIQVRITIPWASNTPTRFVLQDQGTVSVDAFMLRE
jgi:Flp pilus assembly protein TadG